MGRNEKRGGSTGDGGMWGVGEWETWGQGDGGRRRERKGEFGMWNAKKKGMGSTGDGETERLRGGISW